MRPRSDALLEPGALIGDYRVEHPLGQGGTGSVVAASHVQMGKRVAIKVLRRDMADEPSLAGRFEREARSVSQLSDPAIIEIFALGKLSDARPYLVMPLLAGRSLRERLDAAGKLTPKEAWQILREVARGLEKAHAQGIIHRDIKPDNIFLRDRDGAAPQPVVVDFGLAKLAAESEAADAEPMKLTSTGVPMGTPLYMAPEQWWASEATEATDRYGFGVMLFECLAGRPPFSGTRLPELLEAHLHRTPPSLAETGCEVAPAVETLVAQLLAKDPDDRLESFSEVLSRGDQAFGWTAAAEAAADTPQSVNGNGSASGSSSVSGTMAFAATQGDLSGGPNPARESTSPSARRRSASYLAAVLGSLLVLLLVGYPGPDSRDVLEWIHNGGAGMIPMVLSAIAGALLLPRVLRGARSQPRRGLWALLICSLPGLFSLPATYLGWVVVGKSAQRAPGDSAFAILHLGYWEVSVVRFLGLGLSAALALGMALLLSADLPRATPSPARTRWARLIGAAGGLAAICSWLLGLPSTALVALALAVFVVAIPHRHPGHGSVLVLSFDRLLAASLAFLCWLGIAFTHLGAHGATAWFENWTRAERVTKIVEVSSERAITWPFAIAVVSLAAVAAWLNRGGLDARASAQVARQRLPPSGSAGLVALLLILILDVVVQRDFGERRQRIAERLADQLALFSRLSPPTLDPNSVPLPPPTNAPTLQVTRDLVALDGKKLGRMAALGNDETRMAITVAIVAGIARDADAEIDIAFLVDGAVTEAELADLAGITYAAGARRAEILLTRGSAIVVPDGAPAEASQWLPRDFAALRVELEATAHHQGAERTLHELTSEWQRSRVAGSLPLKMRATQGIRGRTDNRPPN